MAWDTAPRPRLNFYITKGRVGTSGCQRRRRWARRKIHGPDAAAAKRYRRRRGECAGARAEQLACKGRRARAAVRHGYRSGHVCSVAGDVAGNCGGVCNAQSAGVRALRGTALSYHGRRGSSGVGSSAAGARESTALGGVFDVERFSLSRLLQLVRHEMQDGGYESEAGGSD